MRAELGIEQVLEDLVLVDAVAGLVDGQTRQFLGGALGGAGHGLDDAVGLFLGHALEGLEGLARCLGFDARLADGDEFGVEQ